MNAHPRIEKVIDIRVISPIIIVVGLVGLLAYRVIQNPYAISYPVAILAAVFTFYALANKEEAYQSYISLNRAKEILLLYTATAISLFTLYYTSGYVRTPSVFILTFLLYIISGLYIFTNGRTGVSLSLIFATGVINRSTAFYGSAMYVGLDIYGHEQFIRSIVSSGTLEGMAASKYFYAPIFHLLISSGQTILGLSTRTIIGLIMIISVTVIPMLVVYSLLDLFWPNKVALIGSLLYLSADHVVYWGIHTIPTTLGVVFFSLLILFVLKYSFKKSARDYVLTSIFLLLIMLVHQVSLFISIVAIFSLTVSLLIWKLKITTRLLNISLMSILIVFIDFTTTKYGGPISDASFFDIVLSQFVASLSTAGVNDQAELPADPSFTSAGSEALNFVQVSGSAILVFFGIVGLLYWISSRDQPLALLGGVVFGVIVTILFAFTLGGPVIGLRNLLPNRWFAFNYIPLSVLAAPGLLWITAKCTIDRGWSTANSILVFLLLLSPYIVLMGGSAMASPDNPFFNRAPGAERLGTTQSEQHTIDHSVEYNSEGSTIVADFFISRMLSRSYNDPTSVVTMDYWDPNTIVQENGNVLIIHRAYMQSNHARYYLHVEQDRHNVYGSIPINEIDERSVNVIYDNGNNNVKDRNKQ